jgi:mannosyltransferase OCH1-like enzyme
MWFGPHPMRAELHDFGRMWESFGYRVVHWTEQNLPPLINADVWDEIARRGVNVGGGDPAVGVHVQRADIVGYELAFRFGGIVANTDIEPLQPLDPILDGVRAFAGREDAHNVCNALIGCTPRHPFYGTVVARLARRYFSGEQTGNFMNIVTGPGLLTSVANERDDLTVFGSETFYPFNFLEMEREWDTFPDAYTRHHWGHTRRA